VKGQETTSRLGFTNGSALQFKKKPMAMAARQRIERERDLILKDIVEGESGATEIETSQLLAP